MRSNGSPRAPSPLIEISCPLCDDASHRLVHHVRDRLQVRVAPAQVETEQIFCIVACSSCGFWYLNPRPKAGDSGLYYKTESYDPHRRRGGGLIGFAYRLLRPLSVCFRAARVSEGMIPGKLLDVGCGSGEFLREMRRRGWQVLGIEKDSTAASLAQGTGCAVLLGDPGQIGLPEDSFDLITFWHSLEHLPDIKSVIVKVADRLTEGGRLAIALPNPDSLDARFYGTRWAAWDAPRHLYHFRLRDLQRLLQFAAGGFRLMKRISLPLDPFYNALLSEVSWNSGAAAVIKSVRGLTLGALSFMAGLRIGQGSSTMYVFEKN